MLSMSVFLKKKSGCISPRSLGVFLQKSLGVFLQKSLGVFLQRGLGVFLQKSLGVFLHPRGRGWSTLPSGPRVGGNPSLGEPPLSFDNSPELRAFPWTQKHNFMDIMIMHTT